MSKSLSIVKLQAGRPVWRLVALSLHQLRDEFRGQGWVQSSEEHFQGITVRAFSGCDLSIALLAAGSFAATINTRSTTPKSKKVVESQHARHHMRHLAHSRGRVVRHRVTRTSLHTRRHRRYYEHFTASSFVTTDVTEGDVTAGEDPVVRQAAIDALGDMNGTVVAIEPTSGRILAMVNQKLALSSGAQPCSTIKLSVALAALSEGIITKDTPIHLGGRYRMNLTTALAHSNNAYFEALGRDLGFEKVHHYAHEFGLGELAGYNIPGEQLGQYPDEAIPASQGGVGKMCSLGEGVSMTPLQLAPWSQPLPTAAHSIICSTRPRRNKLRTSNPSSSAGCPSETSFLKFPTAWKARCNMARPAA